MLTFSPNHIQMNCYTVLSLDITFGVEMMKCQILWSNSLKIVVKKQRY